MAGLPKSLVPHSSAWPLLWVFAFLLGSTHGPRASAAENQCPRYRLETWSYVPKKNQLQFLGAAPQAFTSCTPPLTLPQGNVRFTLRASPPRAESFTTPLQLSLQESGDLLQKDPNKVASLRGIRRPARAVVFRVNVPERLQGALRATLEGSIQGRKIAAQGLRAQNPSGK